MTESPKLEDLDPVETREWLEALDSVLAYEGADRAFKDLHVMLSLGEHGAWVPPILKTAASRDEGIEPLAAELARHQEHLRTSGELERRRLSHLRLRVETLLKERVVAEADQVLGVEREVEEGFGRRLDPYQVADRLFAGVLAAPHPEEVRR